MVYFLFYNFHGKKMLPSHEIHFLEKIFLCLNIPFFEEKILNSSLVVSINNACNGEPSSVIIELSGTPPLFTLFMDLCYSKPTLLVNSKIITHNRYARYNDVINIIKHFLKEYYLIRSKHPT